MRPFCLLLLAASLSAVETTSLREWRFARFGLMPDGSRLAEPGAADGGPVSASSEESDKGNSAARAFDGDDQTRWCADGPGAGQWIQAELPQSSALAALEVSFERVGAWAAKVELSEDGARWTAGGEASAKNADRLRIATRGAGRFIRLTLTATPPGVWAGAREVRLLDATGSTLRPGKVAGRAAKTPAEPQFDDSGWRPVTVPHDWGVEGPFRMDLENETGKLPWAGIGWYRTTLAGLGASDRARKLYLDFDGAMSHPTIYVNGRKAGEWAYGYASFRIDITPFVRCDGTDVVAVRLDNPPKSSRWYPGGGLYRDVRLVRAATTHLAKDGVFISAPRADAEQALLRVSAEVEGADAARASVSVRLLAGEASLATATLTKGADGILAADLAVTKPRRWDITDPFLHTVEVTVSVDGKVVDSERIPFGIREARWDAARGFLLNGRVVKLDGVCLHHDQGPLGAAAYPAAIQRQIRILKEMGCNAIRTSHNPPSPELLKACDAQGLVVMDELFDAWTIAKKPNDYHRDYAAWHQRDVAAFIRRDRNHASVVIWSTGNEIEEQGSKAGHAVSTELRRLVRLHDDTRPVTAGMNNLGSVRNGFAATLDVVGLNYPWRSRDIFTEAARLMPDKPRLGSETSSCVSSRDKYYFPVSENKGQGFFEFQVSSYDLYAPGWAAKPDLEFDLMDRDASVAGEFVWTGFDYLGEPTPYNQDTTNALNFRDPAERERAMAELRRLGNRAPSRSSYFGIIDLCGFPKDRYYLYQARWRPELPMAHILPHWNWAGREGQVTPVHVYTSGDRAELFLNGKSLGVRDRSKGEHRLVWNDVRYEPGELRVVVTRQGKPWTEARRESTGAATSLRLTLDRTEIRADNLDLAYLTVEVVDAKGRVVPTATDTLKFDAQGAEIVAVDNGDATDLTTFSVPERKTFGGKCLAIVRASRSGEKTLRVTSPTLPTAEIQLQAR
jgi:beta-galactosidase